MNTIILGDFNAPDIDLLTLTAKSGFLQLIMHPTHVHGIILDLIMNQIYSEGTCTLCIRSDRHPVSFKHDPIRIFDYSKGDCEGLNEFLSNNFSICYQSENVEFIWYFIKSVLLDEVKKFIPSIILKSNSYPKWFTPNMRHGPTPIKMYSHT